MKNDNYEERQPSYQYDPIREGRAFGVVTAGPLTREEKKLWMNATVQTLQWLAMAEPPESLSFLLSAFEGYFEERIRKMGMDN